MVGAEKKKLTTFLRSEFRERFICYLGISGMNQNAVAKAMGWSRQQVSQLVVGRAMPQITTLHSLAKVLNVPPDRLFPTGNDAWRKSLDFDASQLRVAKMVRDYTPCPQKFSMKFKKVGDV